MCGLAPPPRAHIKATSFVWRADPHNIACMASAARIRESLINYNTRRCHALEIFYVYISLCIEAAALSLSVRDACGVDYNSQ